MIETPMKLICISTLTNVGSLHHKREMTILQALRKRGADVRFYYCDGCDGICDGLGNINPQACIACGREAVLRAKEMGFDPIPLFAGETAQARSQARQWVDAYKDAELPQAKYGDYPLGAWCLSSVYTYWRIPEYNPGHSEMTKWYRGLLMQSLRLLLAVDKVFSTEKADRVLLYNARMAYVKVPFELARAYGIPIFTHERGALPTQCRIGLNGTPFNKEILCHIWDTWKDIPLSKEEILFVAEVLTQRSKGNPQFLNWYAYTQAHGQSQALRSRLGIAEKKRVWALFTSSNHEIIGRADYKQQGFASQPEWIESAIVKAGAYPDVHLVIRAHPNLTAMAAPRAAKQELSYFKFLKRCAGPSATVIAPDENVSSYDLMDLASVGLCYMSTCGLEMAAQGKPICLASSASYDCLTQVDRAWSPDDMDKVFQRYSELPAGHRDHMLRRMAYRFWYILLRRNGFDFPFLHYPQLVEGQYAYFSPDHLEKGRHAHLDLICDAILAGDYPLQMPDAIHISRTTADEDAFFGQDADPAALAEAAAQPRETPRKSFMTIPVAFIVRNGGREAVRSLNSLAGNGLAQDTDLHVFVRRGAEFRGIEALPSKGQVFHSVTLHEVGDRQELCDMVIAALERMLDEYESVIVLDDGLYFAPQTLMFLNTALLRYRHIPNVACICAASPSAVTQNPDAATSDALFLPRAFAMGFGLWRDRWRKQDRAQLGTIASRQPGSEDERESLSRLLTLLCLGQGGLCVSPAQAHACHIGPEGAACRKGFARIPAEPRLPYEAKPTSLARHDGPRHAPQETAPFDSNPAEMIRRHLQVVVRRKQEARLAVMVNIGCGRHFHEEWINLDMLGDFSPVIPWNLLTTLPLSDASCDVVYSCHSLEHFHAQDASGLLAECRRMLKAGGVLRVVVPDLEDQARNYLRCLDEARSAPDDHEAAARHEWMIVELVDQLARHETGGRMLWTWAQKTLPAEELIASRMGREFLASRAGLKDMLRPSAPPRDLARVGAFRLSGEVHQWMYDELSLRRLLLASGFSSVRVHQAHTTDIPDFARFNLDVLPDGSIYRPCSLYMEATA